MLSPADVLVLGAAALLFFGPEQLPKVARNVGRVVRDVQLTSQSFIREMERAADEADLAEARKQAEPPAPPPVSPTDSGPPAGGTAGAPHEP